MLETVAAWCNSHLKESEAFEAFSAMVDWLNFADYTLETMPDLSAVYERAVLKPANPKPFAFGENQQRF